MYSAAVSTSSRSVSTETPSQRVPSFDHLVTQWMSVVISSEGSSLNSSHAHLFSSSTSPTMEKSHSSSGVRGVGRQRAPEIHRPGTVRVEDGSPVPAACGDPESPGKRTLRSCRIPPGSFACTLAHRSFALHVSTMTLPGSSVNADQKGNDANQIRD